jgi:hypothetical protein
MLRHIRSGTPSESLAKRPLQRRAAAVLMMLAPKQTAGRLNMEGKEKNGPQMERSVEYEPRARRARGEADGSFSCGSSWRRRTCAHTRLTVSESRRQSAVGCSIPCGAREAVRRSLPRALSPGRGVGSWWSSQLLVPVRVNHLPARRRNDGTGSERIHRPFP